MKIIHNYSAYFFLLCVIFVSGCVTPTQVVGGGLFVSLNTDPSTVFPSGALRLNMDIDNKNTRTVTNVMVHVFDTGALFVPDQTCLQQIIPFMRPDEFKTFSCPLIAPPKEGILHDKITTAVNARVEYTTDLPVVQLVEMMTEDEYIIRLESGRLQRKSQSYSYRDKNVEIVVDFSDEMPIVVRPERQRDYFVYFTIRNIGNGFIQDLERGDFLLAPVRPDEPNILTCEDLESASWSLQPQGKEFPRIACRLGLPSGVTVVENYGLLILLKYTYEVREAAEVTVIR